MLLLHISKYEKLIKKFIKNKDDNETGHIIQDDIYRTFIKDITKNKFKNIDEIIEIANLINQNIIKFDKNRFYS